MTKPFTPNKVLIAWASKNDINAADFARAMGYSYNHAAVVFRDEFPVTVEMLGRLLIVYGVEVAVPVADAIRAQEARARKEQLNNGRK